MVTLCLIDNALVIGTDYSNGCRYKDLLTSRGGVGGVVVAAGGDGSVQALHSAATLL